MVSEEDLLNVVKSTVRENGEFGRLKADLMMQVMRPLRVDSQLMDVAQSRPQPPASVGLANLLISDYLRWAGLSFTHIIFTAEASLPADLPSRADLARDLNVRDEAPHPADHQPPLLLSILATLKQTTPQD